MGPRHMVERAISAWYSAIHMTPHCSFFRVGVLAPGMSTFLSWRVLLGLRRCCWSNRVCDKLTDVIVKSRSVLCPVVNLVRPWESVDHKPVRGHTVANKGLKVGSLEVEDPAYDEKPQTRIDLHDAGQDGGGALFVLAGSGDIGPL